MCGIAGQISWGPPPDPELVAAMTAAIAHRGPDSTGVETAGPVCFGHRRLSIIDLSSAGHQPMWDAERELLLTFNGEIYNFREVRAELEARGHVFRTNTDTEVILQAYKAWGLDAFGRLNGMFALALWDARERRAVLARDRLGEKPLYWRATPDGLLFGSELKTVRLDPSLPDTIDPAALRSFLTLSYVCGEQAMIAGVRRLPPATLLIAEQDKPPVVRQYWDLAAVASAPRRKIGLNEASEQLRALLDDAVRLRMVADVPLGAFLSGGIDSATIVAAMCAVQPAEPPNTFSIGFTESDFDEMIEARASAGALGSHHSDERSTADFIAHLPDMIRVADEPFADTSLMPTWQLSRFARRKTTVALSGDGGDELFAGYVTYRANQLREKLAWLPQPALAAARQLLTMWPADHGKVSFDYKLRRFLDALHLPFEQAHFSWRRILDEKWIAELSGPEIAGAADPYVPFSEAFAAVPNADPLTRACYVDVKTWLVDDVLVKVDRASMAHALEVRTPFLDHRVVEFAFSLPAALKFGRGVHKRVLKASQVGRLPAQVLSRPKAGFNSPVSRWFEPALSGHFERTVLEGPGRELIDRAAATRLRSEHKARVRDHGHALFALTVLGLWLEQGRPAAVLAKLRATPVGVG
jgi:asparagine synthase (glutamine-hydrolysing)